MIDYDRELHQCELVDPHDEIKQGSIRKVYFRTGGDYLLIKKSVLEAVLLALGVDELWTRQ